MVKNTDHCKCCKKNTKTHKYKTPCTKKITYGPKHFVAKKCDAEICGNLDVEKSLTVTEDLTVERDIVAENDVAVENDLVVSGVFTSERAPALPGVLISTALVGDYFIDNSNSSAIVYYSISSAGTTTIRIADEIPRGTTIEFVNAGVSVAGNINIVKETPAAYSITIANQGGTVAPIGVGATLTVNGANVTPGDRIKVTVTLSILIADGIATSAGTYTIA